MSFPARYAILLDGGFLIRKLCERTRPRTFPDAADVEAVATAIAAHSCVAGLTRLRVYFYHAHPATGILRNPISGIETNLARTDVHHQHENILERLELRPDFALRLGNTSTREWKLGERALRSLLQSPRLIEPNDLIPNIEQKGVDLRIGLDIARLALTRSVQSIVAVTADSDFVPAFKFARREGLRVFLCHFDHPIKRELRAHTDDVIHIQTPVAKSAETTSRPYEAA
jgi:uncharacterized LabA/DUF88 family protein